MDVMNVLVVISNTPAANNSKLIGMLGILP